MSALATAVLAEIWPYHHGMGTGGWIWMMFGMVIFWGAIIVLVVWLVRGGPRSSRTEPPQEILRRRLADGSISVEEYEQRYAALEPSTLEAGSDETLGTGTTGGPTAPSPSP